MLPITYRICSQKSTLLFAVCTAFALATSPARAEQFPEPAASVIAASIASYDGKCPCPYTIKANGKMCGKASAYSRAGGDRIICFPADIRDGDLIQALGDD